MIKQIQLKCFRKHEDLSIELGEGLQTFKGANEAGKTSILEGMAYALFGSKALRGSLADVVTWGHRETELKATVVYQTEGKTYTFTRSKAGAEVYLDGSTQPFVTGQNEVSTFAASMLGAEVHVAHHLMLAGQGGLRGVLEQGPKATAGLIETLSDLDLIDRIIEAAQEKLQLGSTNVLADRLKQAEARLAGLEPVPQPEPLKIEKLQADLQALKAEAEKHGPIAKIAVDLYEAEAGRRKQRDQLERDRNQVLAQAEKVGHDIAALKEQILIELPNVEALRTKVREFEEFDARSQEFRLFKKLPVVEVYLHREPVVARMKELEKLRSKLRVDLNTVKMEIAALEPQISDTHTCKACGQDTSHLEAVKVKQEKMRASLADLQQRLPEMERQKLEADTEFDQLDSILMLDGQVEKAAAGIRRYAARDHSFIPVRITWNGDEPGDVSPNTDAAKEQLSKAEKLVLEQSRLQGQLEALRSSVMVLASQNAKVDAEISELNLLSEDEFTKLEASMTEACDDLARLEGLVAMQQILIEGAVGTHRTAEAAYKAYISQCDGLQNEVATLIKDIETTEFNNHLIKKIRAARPIISNKLWNMVLTSVSVLFSQMRGEQTVVTRTKDGFLANGKPVESLSGSTLDILGLAIRCALIKTFVPACPFLVLDEPSAACDADRSAALVGFVTAAGFKQVIMVTHEEISDAASANLIAI